jgi:hypothetical protein
LDPLPLPEFDPWPLPELDALPLPDGTGVLPGFAGLAGFGSFDPTGPWSLPVAGPRPWLPPSGLPDEPLPEPELPEPELPEPELPEPELLGPELPEPEFPGAGLPEPDWPAPGFGPEDCRGPPRSSPPFDGPEPCLGPSEEPVSGLLAGGAVPVLPDGPGFVTGGFEAGGFDVDADPEPELDPEPCPFAEGDEDDPDLPAGGRDSAAGASGTLAAAGALSAPLAGAAVAVAGAVEPLAAAGVAAAADDSAAHAAFLLPWPEPHESAAAIPVVAAANAAVNRSVPATARPRRPVNARARGAPLLRTGEPQSRYTVPVSIGRAARTKADITPTGGAKTEALSDLW